MTSFNPAPASSLTAPPAGANGEVPVFPKKRKRGATRLSCAECRRLKLRCDRQIPCGSCIKRGCSAICPDGSLTTGKGNRRFVLASTQELHEKVALLSSRIRDLEDALRTSHAQQSPELHPLLAEDLLTIKAPIQREGLAQLVAGNEHAQGDSTVDVVDNFGSLHISDTGRTSYFGQATSSWNEERREQELDNRRDNLKRMLPPEILTMAGVFPVASHLPPTLESDADRLDNLRSLFWHLPPANEAAELRQIYYTHAAWMYNPVSPAAFNEQAFNVFYNVSAPPQLDDPLLTHQLALMFMVLAIGSLMDLSRPAYNVDAEKYHQLARAALFQSPVFEEPTISAVQTLYLMAFYLFLCERHGTGVGTRWAFMGLAVKLSVSVNRDAGRWNLEPVEIQRRRETFWEVYSYDLLQSYTLGRPPSFSLAHIDCKKPHTEDPNNEQTFHWWKHKFTSECMNSVYDQAFGAKVPTYSTVTQLDRRLRSFPVPALLQIAGFGATEARANNYADSIPLILQRHTVLAIRESYLLYMHRGFFARAINDHPTDPLGSPYGGSFIAAYRSAGSLVALVRNVHSQLKELTERMWFLWTHLFSCSIILGSIVTRCPSMSLAPSALVQLDSACELFAKAAHFFKAEKVLDIMRNLQARAHAALAASRNSPPHIKRSTSEPSTPSDAQTSELNILGGRTRLVAPKEKSMSPQLQDRSPTSLNPIVPLPLKQTDWQEDNVHPSVVQYLQTFRQGGGYVNDQPMAGPSGVGMHQMHSGSFDQHHQHRPQPDLSPITTSFGQASDVYQHQQQQQQMGMMPMDGIMPSFPQYFPVFDYGLAGDSNGVFVSSPSNSIDGGDPRSYSPETAQSLHSTWQDFVAQMGGTM
ncbi:hypothetical protein DAEQUDRAFT_667064 [Daedalea quercina L-15889]|uniref:Zn(2)-C6 fungal-type domain-containing protein n=1 Tax=Daedalea quercina L-15889 TaxID=1314783 RepID=A0A165RHH5_9APHY|nr:hypothetical protein DAEQUDRAFT_667064 [Daedalea quercina L-15889]